MNPIRYTLLAAALVSATLASSGPAIAGQPIDETRDVAADAIIDLEIPNGIVTLSGWDRQQFRISGELSDNAEDYDLRELGGGIRFRENSDRRSRFNCWNWNGCGNDPGNLTNVEIQVPRDSVLQFEGINVEIIASGLQGNTEIEVVNGEIEASGLRGVIKLVTVNGSIDARDLEGRLTLETVNGSIDDRNSNGSRVSYNAVNGSINSNTRSPRIVASNVNGDMELDLGSIDELELSTVGGRLEIVAELNEMAQVYLASVGGRIDLSLPDTTSARFRARTAVGGRISNQLSADEAIRENRYVNSSELTFTLNGGRSDVQITTVTGNIMLRRK